MTLNQILKRIKLIALSHRQVRSYKRGFATDFFTDQKTKYPAVLLQDNGGSISISGGATSISFRMFILDLVHVSQNAKDNEEDVLSDTLSIAMDLIAQMNANDYSDWRISVDNSIELIKENDNDLNAGVVVDFTIRTPFTQNICAVPSDLEIEINPDVMSDKLVYYMVYDATGAEGTTLTVDHIPAVIGKKLLIVTRSSFALTPVSNLPDSTQYTWDNETFELSNQLNTGERILFVYRNY
jgi:hypothetical protein